MSVLPKCEAEAWVRWPPLRIGAHPVKVVPVVSACKVCSRVSRRKTGGSLKLEATPTSWLVDQVWYLGEEGHSYLKYLGVLQREVRVG